MRHHDRLAVLLLNPRPVHGARALQDSQAAPSLSPPGPPLPEGGELLHHEQRSSVYIGAALVAQRHF